MTARFGFSALWHEGTVAGLTDGVLLDRFLIGPSDQAETAFATLVERHGPMILHVCRRHLRNRHAAEDAAQATFLILARQAHSIRRADSLASWLYGVAGRVASRAVRDAARRQAREHHAGAIAWTRRQAAGLDPGPSIGTELHEELDRLPERFRLALLCHLEGLTYEQAAQRLGCPVRTIQSRLARARQRLRDRLIRRGVAPSVVALSLEPRAQPAALVVAEVWKHLTVRAAVRSLASGPKTALVSARVAGLVQGVSRVMICQQLVKWTAVLATLGGTIGGARVTLNAWSAPARAATAPAFNPAMAPVPVPPVVDDRWRVKTSDGASIEVVAISTVPTGPDTWWRPDGTRLAEPPVDTIAAKNKPVDGEIDRVVLVRTLDLKRTDLFRWSLTATTSWGGQPQREGRNVPELEYYEAAFAPSTISCGLIGRVATGPWKTEVSNDGKGGFGTFVNDHKFTFGKARPITTVFGKPGTNFAVAHNFFNQDRRLVAIDQVGTPHKSVADSIGSDGDPRWQVDLIDAEFALMPDQIRAYEVQFRPFEEVKISAIPLHPAK